ncbi:MAG: hypothetical protein HY021_03965 [Burkholderiales bacterium]|nr:hypothetical protein [Burkholderiales bacterium]
MKLLTMTRRWLSGAARSDERDDNLKGLTPSEREDSAKDNAPVSAP